MTVSTLPAATAAPTVTNASDSRRLLLTALDMGAAACADAHHAARTLIDAVLACQMLPTEVYRYAPDLTHTVSTLTAATGALTRATGAAIADPTPERLHALNLAVADVLAATGGVHAAVAALQAAAAWLARPAALPTVHHPQSAPGDYRTW